MWRGVNQEELHEIWLGHDTGNPPRPGSPNALGSPPGTGPANVLPPTSSPWREGRAFRSLDGLHARQGGLQILAGSALTLAAATRTWEQLTDTPPAELISTIIR